MRTPEKSFVLESKESFDHIKNKNKYEIKKNRWNQNKYTHAQTHQFWINKTQQRSETVQKLKVSFLVLLRHIFFSHFPVCASVCECIVPRHWLMWKALCKKNSKQQNITKVFFFQWNNNEPNTLWLNLCYSFVRRQLLRRIVMLRRLFFPDRQESEKARNVVFVREGAGMSEWASGWATKCTENCISNRK